MNNTRTQLAALLLDLEASKEDVITLLVCKVEENFPHLSDADKTKLAWRFLKDLTTAAQEVEAGCTR